MSTTLAFLDSPFGVIRLQAEPTRLAWRADDAETQDLAEALVDLGALPRHEGNRAAWAIHKLKGYLTGFSRVLETPDMPPEETPKPDKPGGGKPLSEQFSLAFSARGFPEVYAKHKPTSGQGGLFDESKHPRADDGKFAETAGGGGGKSEDKPVAPGQLAKGREVEAEHTDKPAEAEKIAKDHLEEDPNYYDKLEAAGLVDEPAAKGEEKAKPRVGRSRHAVQFPQPIIGPSGKKLLSYDWKYTLEPDEEGEERRVSDWEQSVTSEHTGKDIVHHFFVADPDGTGQTVSLESALKLLGYTPESRSAGVANIRSLGSAVKRRALAQMELDHREDLLKRVDSAVDEWEAEEKKHPSDTPTYEKPKNFPAKLVDEYKAATGGYSLDPRHWKQYQRKTLTQENDRVRSKIGDIEKQIEHLSREAADEASGKGGPGYHREQLRAVNKAIEDLHADPNGTRWQDVGSALAAQMKARGATSRKDMQPAYDALSPIVRRLYQIAGRNMLGEKTPRSLHADEVPERKALGGKVPAIPAATDRKVTKWYLEHKDEIQSVLKDLEAWRAEHLPDTKPTLPEQFSRLFAQRGFPMSQPMTLADQFQREFYARRKPAAGQSSMWDEEAHPRDESGEFTSKGAGGGGGRKEAKDELLNALNEKGHEALKAAGGFFIKGKGFVTQAQARKMVGITAEQQGVTRQQSERTGPYGDYAWVAAINKGMKLSPSEVAKLNSAGDKPKDLPGQATMFEGAPKREVEKPKEKAPDYGPGDKGKQGAMFHGLGDMPGTQDLWNVDKGAGEEDLVKGDTITFTIDGEPAEAIVDSVDERGDVFGRFAVDDSQDVYFVGNRKDSDRPATKQSEEKPKPKGRVYGTMNRQGVDIDITDENADDAADFAKDVAGNLGNHLSNHLAGLEMGHASQEQSIRREMDRLDELNEALKAAGKPTARFNREYIENQLDAIAKGQVRETGPAMGAAVPGFRGEQAKMISKPRPKPPSSPPEQGAGGGEGKEEKKANDTADKPLTTFHATFKHPLTGKTIAESVEARDANHAMDVIWDKYHNVGYGVGSMTVSPKGKPLFPTGKGSRTKHRTAEQLQSEMKPAAPAATPHQSKVPNYSPAVQEHHTRLMDLRDRITAAAKDDSGKGDLTAEQVDSFVDGLAGATTEAEANALLNAYRLDLATRNEAADTWKPEKMKKGEALKELKRRLHEAMESVQRTRFERSGLRELFARAMGLGSAVERYAKKKA